jgi:hypothetical protein
VASLTSAITTIRRTSNERELAGMTPSKARREPAPDPYGRRVRNPGGPVTDADLADARGFLNLLATYGSPDVIRLTTDKGLLSNHFGPDYDPNRIVRILTALTKILPEFIDTWRYSMSRADAEKYWVEWLFGDHCATCTLRCHICHQLAGLLGYERVEAPAGTAPWRKQDADTST